MANGILNFSTTGIPIWNDKNRNHSEKYDKNNRKKKLVKCAAIISRWNISILPVSILIIKVFLDDKESEPV